jgi:hypothetical protein
MVDSALFVWNGQLGYKFSVHLLQMRRTLLIRIHTASHWHNDTH